jgi:DNA-binding response OmpR family regulator
MAATVLIVEDELKIRELLRGYFEREGFGVVTTASGAEAITLASTARPDLIVLDLRLPDVAGETVAAEVRRQGTTPILMLTAKAGEEDRIRGLDLGADDYVVKPFSPREVVARVRAVLRRGAPPSGAQRLEFPDLVIDLDRRAVYLDEQPVELTRREFDLLAFLASSPRRVFSREQILVRVWGSSGEWQSPTTVTEHVRRLRQRLDADPERPRHLISVRGVGYRFEP